MADDDRFYVKSLTLENFRCFEKAELGPFDPHFNLLVGENGAGKSSVLVALASLFRNLADRGGLLPSDRIAGRNDVRSGTEPNFTLPGSNFAYPSWATSALFRWRADEMGAFDRLQLQPSINGPSLNSYTSGSVTNVAGDFRSPAYSTREELILFYDIDRRFRRSAQSTGNDLARSPLNPAYANWLEAGASASELVSRLKDKTLEAYQAGRDGPIASDDPSVEKNVIEEAVAAAQFGFKKIEFLQRVGDIVVDTIDDRRYAFGRMSSGQRAFIGMIADIAWRAFALKGEKYGRKTLEEATGLVLIDEIDLHLHPKWQRQIVPALKKVFPKIQFFATTHSPQVIGECKPEEIVLLTKDGKQRRPPASYGMDSSWILECVMEAEGREPEIGRRISALFTMLDDGRFDEARAEMASLRQVVGLEPKLAAAETYLWNLEHGSDEAAE